MATKPLSEYTVDELRQRLAGNDPYKAPPPPSGIIRRTVGDPLVGAAQSVVGLGEMGVGLADLATAGYASKGLGAIGYDPTRAREIIGQAYSPEMQENLRQLQTSMERGPGDVALTALARPSLIPTLVAQSAAPLAATIGTGGAAYTGALARGLTRAQAVQRAGTAATATEGALAAGDITRNITESGAPISEAYKYAVPAGVGTALVGKLGGYLTGGPLEAILARRAAGQGAATIAGRTFIGRAATGAAAESGEEALQSSIEAGATNLGTGQPFTEGMASQAALGAIVGGAMGAGLGALTPGAVSTDALSPYGNKRFVDPLGDQREQFVTQLNTLKEKYVNDVGLGVPEETAFRDYQIAAQELKDTLLAASAVGDEQLTPPPVTPEENIPVFGEQDAALLEGVDLEGLSPMQGVLDQLGDLPTGEALAHAISTATPEQLLEIRNAALTALAEANADPEFVGMATEILDNPALAAERIDDLNIVLKAMEESRDAFDASVIEDVLLNNPELAEAFPDLAGAARPTIGERIRSIAPENLQQMIDDNIVTQEEVDNALQEQTAAEVDVREQAGDGQGLGQRDKGLQASARKGKAKAASKAKVAKPKAAPKPKAGIPAEKVSAPVQAAKTAAEGLLVQPLPGIPRTAKSSLIKRTVDAMVDVMFGGKARVVRDVDGEANKAATAKAASWQKQVDKIVGLSRRLDKLMAKASPRVSPSKTDISGRVAAIDDALVLLSGKRVSKSNELKANEAYRKIRAGVQGSRIGGGKNPDPEQVSFLAGLQDVVDSTPEPDKIKTPAETKAALASIRQYLMTNTPGRQVMSGKFVDEKGDSIADLNDQLARAWDEAILMFGGKKGNKASIETAKANIDRIIGAYKTEKYARNKADAELLAEIEYEGDEEYGAFMADEAGEAASKAVAAARNKLDYHISMSWTAYKDGRLPRLRNIRLQRSTAPLSPVSDRPVRQATETGMAEDAPKSPLAKAYEEGYLHNPDDPNTRTPPGARAVLSYMAASQTGMTRVLSNLLKESLASRMPSKTNPNPKNPVHIKFLTPEEAIKFGVSSARWHNNAALQNLRKIDPSLPADGDMILVATTSPEAVLHEMFHASTASWILANPNHKTVLALKAQLNEAIKKANEMSKAGVSERSPLHSVILTLQSIEAAGKNVPPAEGRARQIAEFVSYAMTRSSFQEFLSAINTKGIESTNMAYTKKERSFIKTMSSVWNKFIESLRVMLNLAPPTATSPVRAEKQKQFMDYLVNRVMFIGATATADGKQGRKAFTADQAPFIMDHTALDHSAGVNMSSNQVASLVKAAPANRMNVFDRITSAPFRILFPGLYGNDGQGILAKEESVGARFDEFLKAHPWAAAAIGPWVEFAGTNKSIRQRFREYIRERDAANFLGNIIEDALRDQPLDQQAEFMQALLEPAARNKLSDADKALVESTERMIKQLQEKAAGTGGLAKELVDAPISELIQYAVKKRQLATSGFSAGVIALSGQKQAATVENDVVLWDDSTDASSPFDGRYYPVYTKQDPNQIDYFIASNRPADLAAFGADTTASWSYSKALGANKSSFTRNATYKEIRAAYPNVPAAHFLANTLAEMSKVVAGRQLVDSLFAMNNDAKDNGKFIFASEADLKATLGENAQTMVWPKDEVELTPELRRKARRPDTFVLLQSERFGNLKGQYINGAVFSALQDMNDNSQFISSPLYNDALRFWKGTKTKLSPGTHMTNTITNVTMMYLHDISGAAVTQAATIYARDIGRKTGKFGSTKPLTAEQQRMFDLFNESGAVLGNYSSNELHRKMSEALSQSFGPNNNGSVWSISEAMSKYEMSKAKLFNQGLQGVDLAVNKTVNAAKAIDRVMGGAYELEDNVFRFAAFIEEFNGLKQRNPNMSDQDAAKQAAAFARYAMIDYSIHARGVNALRQTALPFLAWTYRAVPMMVRVAYTKPWKMINLMGVYYALNALAYAATGGDEEEERKNLPSWMQQRVFGIGPHAYVRMPWGDPENPVFFGAGKYVPGGDLVAQSDQGIFGNPYIPGALAPSGPAVALLSAAFGWDSFQGRELWQDSNSVSQNMLASAKYLATQMAPINPYPAIENLVTGKKGVVGNDINHMYAIGRYFGIRLHQRNATEDQYSRMKEVQALNRERNAAISRLVRLESRYDNPDWDSVNQEIADLNERMINKINKKLGVE